MRWTMFPPIFPRPTKPSCIWSLLLDLCGQGVERVGGIAFQAQALGGEPVVAQGVQVAGRRGVLERLEGVGLAWDLGVALRAVDQLEEHAGPGPALVHLARGVLE